MEKHIVLQEYGDFVKIPKNSLTQSMLDEANVSCKGRLNLRRLPFEYCFIDSDIYLRAVGICGVIRIGTLEVEIAPKFLSAQSDKWRPILWNMLAAVSESPKEFLSVSAGVGSQLTFPDLLASLFIDSYEAGTVRGLPREYRQVEGQGVVLRGSFDVSKVRDYLQRPWIIPYRTDAFSYDCVLNRLMRWTARHLEGLVSSQDLLNRLRLISADLQVASNHPPHPTDARRVIVGVEHSALIAAKEIGVLLLEGNLQSYGSREFALPGFLLRSDTVYEQFVFKVCERVAANNGLMVSKYATDFGEVISGKGKSLQTIPDVIFRDDTGGVVAVADAKYKILSKNGKPKSADVYQLLAGGYILGCSKLCLIYPSFNDIYSTTWKIDSGLGESTIFMSAVHLDMTCFLSKGGWVSGSSHLGNWLTENINA